MTEQRTIDDVDVFIEGAGTQTLVFIHGWPDTHRLWDRAVAHLAPHYRCVRFTLPGFDLSRPRRPLALDQMVAFFKAVLQQVSAHAPVTLVLHDWGCVFGYEFAARHPELVQRVIGVDIGDSNAWAFIKSLRLNARLMIFLYQFWLALAWLIGGAAGDWMTRAMARAMHCRTPAQDIGAQMNYPYYIQWFRAYGSYHHRLRFKPHCPMLYVYGRRKPFMFHSQQWLQKLEATPGSAVRGFATGHWVMVAQPEAFNQCVAEWLATTSPATAP